MGFSAGGTRVLPSVYVAVLGTWAAYALVLVVLPFRFEQLGLSVEEYGVALACYAAGTLLTEGLWGLFAFRLGSVRAQGLLAGLTATSLVALGFARTFATFCVLLGLYGMLVVYSTPLLRWVGMNAAGPGRTSQALGRLGIFFGVGLSVGTAVGPLVYADGGFWSSVAAGTVLFVGSTVPLLALPWDRIPLPRRGTRAPTALRAIAERDFAVATTLVVLYFMVYTLVTNFLQYYSIDLFRGTVEGAGYVIGAARLVALGSGLFLGSWVDRWGPGRAAPVGFLFLLAGALGSWFSSDYAEMVGSTLVLATGAGWLTVTLLPMALGRILPEHQGTAVGVFGSFEDLGLILGPLLLGVVYARFGPREVFPVTAALAGLAIVLAVGSGRGARRARFTPVDGG